MGMRNGDEGYRVAHAPLFDESLDPVVWLARMSVEGFVTSGRPIGVPSGLPDELLSARAGVFVSLHEMGELRGCIGTIAPTQDNLALEIIRCGVLACSDDPRFPPVAEDELAFLEYSVDVLEEPEPINSLDQLDVLEYGVIVTLGWRRGLLLPNLEGIDSVEQQVAIAKRKAGIPSAEPNVALQRFRVVRHTAGGAPRGE